MSMEHNGGTGNQNLSHNALCRTGCGFYGNSAFEGMCSKCYKDALKRRQQNPSPPQVTTMTSAGRVSPSIGTNLASMDLSSRSSPISPLTTTPSVETASPTITTPSSASQDDSQDDKEPGATGGIEVASEDKDKDGDKEKKPKKNRCHTCKKKVGLTGFQCRCGGLYCSMHRYSDKHGCTFNYKEMAQEQIRKNNPVVVGEKIQKI